jgi:hypothetical protein
VKSRLEDLNGFACWAIVDDVIGKAWDLEGPGEDYHEESWGEVTIKLPVVVPGIIDSKEDPCHEIKDGKKREPVFKFFTVEKL